MVRIIAEENIPEECFEETFYDVLVKKIDNCLDAAERCSSDMKKMWKLKAEEIRESIKFYSVEELMQVV